MKRLRVCFRSPCAWIVSAASASAQDAYPSRPIRFVRPTRSARRRCAGARHRRGIARAARPDRDRRTAARARIPWSRRNGRALGARRLKPLSRWPTISRYLVMVKRSLQARGLPADHHVLPHAGRHPVPRTCRWRISRSYRYAKSKGLALVRHAGIGSSPHMLLERINRLQGTKFEHVAYRGEARRGRRAGRPYPMFAGSVATPASTFGTAR